MASGAKLPRVSPRVSTTVSARLIPAASMANQPPWGSIHARVTRRRVSARAQFVGYASAQVAHLLASDRKALLPGLYFRALLRDLPDDRPRQQFLIVAQRDHMLLIDGVQQAAAARDRYPATARHLERRAGLQSAARKPTFEVRGSRCPFCGQTMKNQILEQHERHPRKESADYIERAPEFWFIFRWNPEFDPKS